MPRVSLTDLVIRNLPLPERQIEYIDTKSPGGGLFGLRLSPSGSRRWFIRYRFQDKRPRYSLGDYPQVSLADARQEALKVLGDVARGIDPASVRQDGRLAETFKELAQLYMERHARIKKAPASAKKDERMIQRFLLPAWKNRKLADIKRKDVIFVLEGLVPDTPVQANRLKALISKIFSFALDRELVEYNPALGVSRPGGKETGRDRVLSDEEIKKLHEAIQEEDKVMGSLFWMILLTGQRPGEVKQMTSKQVSGDIWTIPGEVAKNRLQHSVPLSPQAMAVIEQLEAHSDGIFVFPSYRGGHVTWLAKASERIQKRTKFHFTPHDLRRTAASGMSTLGVRRDVISRLLNHSDGSVTAVYDRYDRLPEMRRALEKWGAHVDRILTGKQAKVVKFR